jgi:hypothetical protein
VAPQGDACLQDGQHDAYLDAHEYQQPRASGHAMTDDQCAREGDGADQSCDLAWPDRHHTAAQYNAKPPPSVRMNPVRSTCPSVTTCTTLASLLAGTSNEYIILTRE